MFRMQEMEQIVLLDYINDAAVHASDSPALLVLSCAQLSLYPYTSARSPERS